jgi:hypothetical protein
MVVSTHKEVSHESMKENSGNVLVSSKVSGHEIWNGMDAHRCYIQHSTNG